MDTLQAITELRRLPSPAPLPLGLAIDGETLWMASRETNRLYAIDVNTWTVSVEAQAEGSPFGMAVVGDELRVVMGYGEKAHDRFIERFISGHGFKSEKIECPDLTGSHLAFDGDTLFLSQASYDKILALDGQGVVLREIELPRRPVGMTIVDGCFYLITTNEQFEDVELWKVDARGQKPVAHPVASIPFDARGLAFDGTRFWTSHRDNNEIVAFEKP
jgi:sugar lactone lactonase YvrE